MGFQVAGFGCGFVPGLWVQYTSLGEVGVECKLGLGFGACLGAWSEVAGGW